MNCPHTTVLVTQHFDGQVQPVYTRQCLGCDEMLLDMRSSLHMLPSKAKR